MADPTHTHFTPERAERYVEGTLPGLFARIEGHLGEPNAEGVQLEAPNAEVARLAILSAREILEELGPMLGADTLVPAKAALARFEKRYLMHHADRPLELPNKSALAARGPVRSLADIVTAAWDGPPGKPVAKSNPAPGLDLPPNGVHHGH